METEAQREGKNSSLSLSSFLLSFLPSLLSCILETLDNFRGNFQSMNQGQFHANWKLHLRLRSRAWDPGPASTDCLLLHSGALASMPLTRNWSILNHCQELTAAFAVTAAN